MFLTEPQLSLIRRAKVEPVDIMEANLCTISALRCRGIVSITYRGGKHPGWTYVKLTDVGIALAKAAALLEALPTYKEVLKEVSGLKAMIREQAS